MDGTRRAYRNGALLDSGPTGGAVTGILTPLRRSTQSRAGRTQHLARVLFQYGLESIAVRAGLHRFGPRFGRLAPKEAHRTEAERVRLALGEMGATFIKLGQMLSTRADLLPPEFIAELSKLQDSAPPVPFAEIEQIVREDLAGLPSPAFLSLTPTPIASASIGQVHAAVLPDGTPVVVKVRRPAVEEQVELDLAILRDVVEWVHAHTPIGRDYDLRPLVDEFAYTLRDELNYIREAQNAAHLRTAFQGDRGVWIPRVFEEFSTVRVLTMERVSGVKISDLTTLRELGVPGRAIAENAVRLFLRQVLEFGIFHADPHPGNFFVQPDASLAIVDFGMVARLSDATQRHLLRAMIAASRQDAEGLSDALYALGVAGPRANRPLFERDLEHLVGRYGSCSVGQLSAATVAQDLFQIAFRHKLQLPSALALLLRVANMSERIGLMLDPEFRYLEYAVPIVGQHWHRQHSLSSLTSKAGQAAIDAAELGVDLPRRASRLLDRLERGEMQIDVTHRGLADLTREFQAMTNRLALSVILGASVIALGLAAGIRLVPALGPIVDWLFRLGLVCSVVFGVSVLWGIWRAGKR
jgi:ubiquinone biosynthesis protein